MMVSDHENVISSPSGGGSPSTHRWNPTKEQINILENMYKQGIRTPSAEQIQEITTKLKVYGHIEGKNVFYWFQNHKARQRQKQKQDSFHRFLQHTSPFLPPPPCPNVVCSPYYFVPNNAVGFYPQCPPKLVLPPTVGKKRSHQTSEHVTGKSKYYDLEGASGGDISYMMMPMHSSPTVDQETLALFPMHPTGILQDKTSNESTEDCSNATTPSSSSDTAKTHCVNDQPEFAAAAAADHSFFDFFSAGNGHADVANYHQSQ